MMQGVLNNVLSMIDGKRLNVELSLTGNKAFDISDTFEDEFDPLDQVMSFWLMNLILVLMLI
jgi:hypothetical protein